MILYNEIDDYAARWLMSLSEAGHIAPGRVIVDSVADINPKDLVRLPITQFHTFAGIGVWSHALRLAGWPDDRPVWTGSCPCQPFSSAGKGLGEDDPRHLWPAWRALIAECLPPTIFGEQVASPAGRAWLDSVSADLEALGYAVGSADLCAAGVGAPHIRQRLFWVAHSERGPSERHGHEMGGAASSDQGGEEERERLRANSWNGCVPDWIPCRDDKARPIEPGTFPLVDGTPYRVGRLRAYGNAIVPQVAAAFIGAFLDVEEAVTRTAPLPPPVDHLTDDDAEIARALFETRKADHYAETRRPRLEVEARLSDGV